MTIRKNNIAHFADTLDDTVMDAIYEEAKRLVVPAAQSRITDQSGDLAASIRVEMDAGEIWLLAGDDDAYYAHIVENGGAHSAPHPYLTPAFESNKAAIQDAARDALRTKANRGGR